MTERKIALITGGGRGIGLSTALELAKAGCDIIINGIGGEETAGEALKQIKECGVNAYYYQFAYIHDHEQLSNQVQHLF